VAENIDLHVIKLSGFHFTQVLTRISNHSINFQQFFIFEKDFFHHDNLNDPKELSDIHLPHGSLFD